MFTSPKTYDKVLCSLLRRDMDNIRIQESDKLYDKVFSCRKAVTFKERHVFAAKIHHMAPWPSFCVRTMLYAPTWFALLSASLLYLW